jgi:hypothetical protein
MVNSNAAYEGPYSYMPFTKPFTPYSQCTPDVSVTWQKARQMTLSLKLLKLFCQGFDRPSLRTVNKDLVAILKQRLDGCNHEFHVCIGERLATSSQWRFSNNKVLDKWRLAAH